MEYVVILFAGLGLASAIARVTPNTGLTIERTRSAASRSWLEWGIPLQHAALGAVCIFKRGGGWQPSKEVIDAPGHVGLLVDIAEPETMTILAGNQGNRICEDVFPVERLLDMRWPG